MSLSSVKIQFYTELLSDAVSLKKSWENSIQYEKRQISVKDHAF